FDESVENLKKARAHHVKLDSWLTTGMLKGFMDGSLGSSTAALLAPYADDHGNSGLPRYSQEQLNKMVAERVAADFQIGFHAIGDRGAEMALDAFAYGAKQANKDAKALRMRIEHDQVIAPSQFTRYRDLGVIASVQPSHLLTDMNWAEARIGKERARTSYPWAQFLQDNVRIAFGTDYPVEPITPFRGLYAAVTRKNETGNKTYYPEQALNIDQAIAAYTRGAAYAEFAETNKGTIAKGMLADFVVLDRDITNVRPEDILLTRVLRTVVGGKTVYEAGPRE
ncbi:MAG TPA: amidohydrolase family protein, partial [Terriglobales bacterium]|nr:amidohydrolase family protein [Terriglobales bacterium]